MNILVIGSGGREHALVWKLAQSPHVKSIECAPGNAGIAQEKVQSNQKTVECVAIGAEDLPALLAFAREKQPALTVVGPDNPLAMGIVDLFEQHGLRIWGPNRVAAQFEASKVFAQNFMIRHGIPTARAATFSDASDAKAFAETLQGQCAVKADGLALGKGVVVCHDLDEARLAIEQMLVRQVFGTAGARIVIQELLHGIELSLHALCDGRCARLFPTSQDHKAAYDGDQGPNTGGMGTYSPTPFLNDAGLAEADRVIIQPWLRGCAAEGIDFRGLLYPGLMMTPQGPKVLEFNARFGDPETQVYLPRLENDLVELLEASRSGTLATTPLRWSSTPAICVVMASGGYPGAYPKGKEISGLSEVAKWPNVKVFHAGTGLSGDRVVTSGGRVLGVTSWGATLAEARTTAYEAVQTIKFEGAQYRNDIAVKALNYRADKQE